MDGNLFTGEHVMIFLGGSSTIVTIAHAVNTFPTPSNKYGAWALGVVQFIVGQRIAGQNTLQGKQSIISTNESSK